MSEDLREWRVLLEPLGPGLGYPHDFMKDAAAARRAARTYQTSEHGRGYRVRLQSRGYSGGWVDEPIPPRGASLRRAVRPSVALRASKRRRRA